MTIWRGLRRSRAYAGPPRGRVRWRGSGGVGGAQTAAAHRPWRRRVAVGRGRRHSPKAGRGLARRSRTAAARPASPAGARARAGDAPSPTVHAHLAPPAALTMADQDRSEPRVGIVLGDRERLVAAQPRHSSTIKARRRAPWTPSPAWRITATISSTVGGSGGSAAPCSRRAPGEIAGQRDRRATAAGGTEQRHGHGTSSGDDVLARELQNAGRPGRCQRKAREARLETQAVAILQLHICSSGEGADHLWARACISSVSGHVGSVHHRGCITAFAEVTA